MDGVPTLHYKSSVAGVEVVLGSAEAGASLMRYGSSIIHTVKPTQYAV